MSDVKPIVPADGWKPNMPKLALEAAQMQVGEKEEPIGSNSGPMVDVYLKSVDKHPGLPWCMAFVYYCFGVVLQAGNAAFNDLAGGNPVVKTAGVMDCWNRTAQSKKIMALEAKARPELVTPGCQFILVFGHGTGHTGIVESVDAARGEFHTIEGNSNNDGSREGYEVVRHLRRFDSATLKGFIKYN